VVSVALGERTGVIVVRAWSEAGGRVRGERVERRRRVRVELGHVPGDESAVTQAMGPAGSGDGPVTRGR
jgi:hypothetical protein